MSIVAWQYDVKANQVFSWRRRYREEPRLLAAPPPPRLIPVTITAEPAAVAAQPSSMAEKIEIDIVGKHRVRIGGIVDGQTLPRVLDILERR